MRRLVLLVLVVTALAVVGAPPASADAVLEGVTQLDADTQITCAVLADTTARCWGLGPLGDGQGPGSSSAAPVPVLDDGGVDPLTGIEQIGVASDHVCVRLADTTARCWGENMLGALGDGTTTTRNLPVTVEVSAGVPLDGIAELAVGDFFTCARLTNGQARCWARTTAPWATAPTPSASAPSRSEPSAAPGTWPAWPRSWLPPGSPAPA